MQDSLPSSALTRPTASACDLFVCLISWSMIVVELVPIVNSSFWAQSRLSSRGSCHIPRGEIWPFLSPLSTAKTQVLPINSPITCFHFVIVLSQGTFAKAERNPLSGPYFVWFDTRQFELAAVVRSCVNGSIPWPMKDERLRVQIRSHLTSRRLCQGIRMPKTWRIVSQVLKNLLFCLLSVAPWN